MSEVLQCILQKRRYARALTQELHLLPQFLGDFGELNLYNKASGRRIIIYKAIFKSAFRYKTIKFSSHE